MEYRNLPIGDVTRGTDTSCWFVEADPLPKSVWGRCEKASDLPAFRHIFSEDYKHRAKHTIYLSSIKFLISSIT